jgi:hypothetical protein
MRVHVDADVAHDVTPTAAVDEHGVIAGLVDEKSQRHAENT